MAIATLERSTERAEIDPSKPLKINHERFLSGYISCGNATQAYVNIYRCTQEAAKSSATALLSNHNVKARLAYLLDSAPRTSAEGAIIKLGQRMEAQKAVVVPVGASVQFVDDNQAQISAATTLLKLHGRLKDGVTINNNTANFVAVTASNAIERLDKVCNILGSLRPSAVIDVVGTTVGKEA